MFLQMWNLTEKESLAGMRPAALPPVEAGGAV